MAVIRHPDDPMPSEGNREPLRSAAACGFTLTNHHASTLGSGRPNIWADDAARAVLRNADMRRYLESLDDDGRMLIYRASPRLGPRCGYWFGVFPNLAGRGRAPMAFTLNVLEEFGIVDRPTANRIYERQRTDAERAADVESMDKTAAQADRHDREFAASRPGFFDDLWSGAKDLLNRAPLVAAVAAAVVVGVLVLRR